MTYQYDYPDTPAKRRAGMAAFRAKLLRTHQAILAEIETTGAYGGRKANKRDVQFQRDTIAAIQAAQVRLGEV